MPGEIALYELMSRKNFMLTHEVSTSFQFASHRRQFSLQLPERCLTSGLLHLRADSPFQILPQSRDLGIMLRDKMPKIILTYIFYPHRGPPPSYQST